MERLTPKPSTLRALFAKSGNECAFPGCSQCLVDERNLFVAEVCHINAVNDTEARLDETLSNEALREYDNLILLCHAHHVRIDSLPDEYSGPALRAMRSEHEKRVEHKVFQVSDETIDDALFQLLESDWEPYFEPTINFLSTEIDEARGGQQGMNLFTGQIGELLESVLYILTLRVLATCTLSERRRFLREHYEWREMRHKETREASLEMEGGSGAPMLYNGTYNVITEKRIEYVRSLHPRKSE